MRLPLVPRGGPSGLSAAALGAAGCLYALSALAACAPSRPGTLPADVAVERGRTDISSVLVYVIHGDADYIYHDDSGRRRLADEDALAQAQDVARNAREAEVFIFHQKPRWRRWTHPAPDAVMFHYRRGVLLKHRSYSRPTPDFAGEAALFLKHASAAALPPRACAAEGSGAAPGPRSFFMYFCHEIPALGALGYSHSHPREEFSLDDFTRGLRRFAGPPCDRAKPLSLLVLSSCRGGTPATTMALFPYADLLLASPTPLHLSFLDTRALIPLLRNPALASDSADARIRAGAEAMARESFRRLQDRTQTGISLALYESRKASSYLSGHAGVWERDGQPVSGIRMAPMGFRDCAEDPLF
jgi:hypothetical protein